MRYGGRATGCDLAADAKGFDYAERPWYCPDMRFRSFLPPHEDHHDGEPASQAQWRSRLVEGGLPFVVCMIFGVFAAGDLRTKYGVEADHFLDQVLLVVGVVLLVSMLAGAVSAKNRKGRM